jgi:hypothetical protein
MKTKFDQINPLEFAVISICIPPVIVITCTIIAAASLLVWPLLPFFCYWARRRALRVESR